MTVRQARRGQGRHHQAVTEHLNPRGTRVVALEKPSTEESTQWYFQRYVRHLPSAGGIVMFDRSWYNRAGVERVMGFCTDADYDEFMRQAPEFERMLVRGGIIQFKFCFSVSRKKRGRIEAMRWVLSRLDYPERDDETGQHTGTTYPPLT
jgi:polyphosphate kinase 2 (PPK2 family)